MTRHEAVQKAKELAVQTGKPHRVSQMGGEWSVVTPEEEVWRPEDRAKIANTPSVVPALDLHRNQIPDSKPVPTKYAVLEAHAESGDVQAQLALGEHLVATGQAQRAIRWLREAAGLGEQRAFLLLGKAYTDPALNDIPEALKWLDRAHALGSSEASSYAQHLRRQYNL
ncbi:tetratricopeptide (TPR) repeat protein [Pseudomonas nitritireducens]|uniref:Tetratricopeptide (TPR) repeat protein n=1 Tax=Pseudomonas nitroreducens TaxID=46680 RepID=A0A7W7KE96_PSENT|nr:sel1 repeat family protein [Pseudomonas nitritireducens]MBB4861242.1 tetratricopeptide (TPR) repeat protein [Pseudomonas nitritireducens]